MNRYQELRTAALVYSLRRVYLFSGLPEADLIKIAGFAIPKTVRKGEYLFRKQEPTHGFYLVRKGIINVHHIASDGREQVIHLFRAGESLGEAAIVSGFGYPADARAVEDSDVILIPKKDFLLRIQEDASLALRMLASVGQRQRALVATIENLKLKDAETRLIHWLLNRCTPPYGDAPEKIPIGVAKSVLASELAIRQETLSRIFGKLRDAGYLMIKQRTVIVNNPNKLHQLFEANLSGSSHAPEKLT